MTQRDDMGREVGGGFRVGNSCTPVADSCQCMAKPIQYWKVKKKKKMPREPSHRRIPHLSEFKQQGFGQVINEYHIFFLLLL